MYGQSHRAGRSNASSPYNYQGSATSLPASGLRSQYTTSPADHVFSSSARTMTAPNMNAGSPSPSMIAMPPPSKTMPNSKSGRLHRRGGSGSGSTLQSGDPGTPTEPFPDLGTPVTTSPASNKKKPYLRKLSSTKEDQGRLDLSRSIAENDRLAGLGIQGSKDVFVPPGRHTRTTSTGSQMSAHSTTSRPNQPFVHPMRQAPRPYTPPTVRSDSPYDDDDDDDDFLDDDHRPHYTFRGKRSMSSSSVPHAAPTPLSKTITIADLGAIPKLTNQSQSNLSIISTKSSRVAGSRRNTGRSEVAPSPSSRTSFDKLSVLGARRSDTDTRTRDERIRAARRKFEEKEADKDRKFEKEAIKRREVEAAKESKRQERQHGQSDASEKGRLQRPGTSGGYGAGRTGSALGKYNFRASDDHPSPPATSTARFLEKQNVHVTPRTAESPNFFTRLFSCGGGRR